MRELKEKLEKLEYQTRAQRGLHEAEALIEEADKHGGKESETANDIFLEALDSCQGALQNAEDAEDRTLEA